MKLFRAALYAAVCGILSQIIGSRLPRQWFHPDRFPFAPREWEQEGSIYRRIGVHHWKDQLPDMSRILPSMVPKRILTGTAQEAHVLALETCVAEAVHFALILLSPGILILCPGGVGVAAWMIYVLVLNLPYIIIQRYNRPKLLRLARRLHQKEAFPVL